jgi:hypothetical protein
MLSSSVEYFHCEPGSGFFSGVGFVGMPDAEVLDEDDGVPPAVES